MASREHLFFDLDGTIIDSSPGILESVAHTSTVAGRPIPDSDTVRTLIGKPLRGVLRDLMPGLSTEELDKSVEVYREFYRGGPMFSVRVYDGIFDALQVLRHRGFHLHILTAKLEEPARSIIQHLKLHKVFENVFGTDPGHPGDNKDQILLGALDTLGVRGEQSAMIGDRLYDIQAGRAAGALSIGVAWGFGAPAELAAAGAHVILNHPWELPVYLGALENDRVFPAISQPAQS